MRICFWGTRGSIAKPGSTTLRYGGNTSCIEVRSADGTLMVLDSGTGIHGLGLALMASGQKPLKGHLLLTHTHWDHIQGMPFFAPLFVPGNEWDIYAPRGLGDNLKDTLKGQMEYTYFPVSIDQLGATIRYHELLAGELPVGGIRVVAQYLNHPALTLGYRLEADGVTVVYSSDHEPHARSGAVHAEGDAGAAPHEGDEQHADFVRGADLLIHDTQYTAAEYSTKIGWGHSPVEYAIDLAISAGVKRLALYHHDPLRTDAALDQIVASGRQRIADAGSKLELFAAAEGQVLDLKPNPVAAHFPNAGSAIDTLGGLRRAGERVVIIAVDNLATAEALASAIKPEDVRVSLASDWETLRRLVELERPGLVIVDQNFCGGSGLEYCRTLRAETEVALRDTPLVLVAANEAAAAIAHGMEAGVTDWLVKPFTPEYARTKMCAWLLRTRVRWRRAAPPVDEMKRLDALRRLNLLDTPTEERFDRLTRLAQRLFHVPISLVSLIDSDRQWFKSAQGLPVREGPRDMSFCAHALLEPEVLVVPDALQDERFAENPLVAGVPRVRFYAGKKLYSPDGFAVGTLCVIDHRPRELDPADRQALIDLAALVQEELCAGVRR